MKTKFEQLFDNADQMAPDINAVYEAGMELVNKCKWLPIETAPDDESIVLVYDGQFVDIGTSVESNSDLYYCFMPGRELNVLYWMPLPEPPEEGE